MTVMTIENNGDGSENGDHVDDCVFVLFRRCLLRIVMDHCWVVVSEDRNVSLDISPISAVLLNLKTPRLIPGETNNPMTHYYHGLDLF